MTTRRHLLCLFLFATSAVLHAQGPAVRTMEANDVFVKESLSRLSSKIPSGQMREVEAKADVWRKTKSNSDFVVLTEAIYGAAKNSDVKSDVTIATSRGSGATVKYQTLGQRQRNEPATTAKRLTEVIESMYLGMYYIWSERAGTTTSDRSAQFDIADVKERVTLEEKQ